MTVTFFEHVVKRAQKDIIGTFHYLDGTSEMKIITKAHSLEHLRFSMSEAIGYILHPEDYYWGPDYPNGFPKNYL